MRTVPAGGFAVTVAQSGIMSKVLVVGATGLLGSAVCAQARAAGYDVRALIRAESTRTAELRGLGCVTVLGDLKNPASLAAACCDVETVVTTANAMTSRASGDSLVSVDRRGSLALVQAAAAAGVRRFVYTSLDPAIRASNAFVRYKREVEQAVRASTMTWTVLQPTAFMEIHAGAPAGWDFARARARIVGAGSAPVGYIAVADVAGFAVAALAHPAALNRDVPLAGPEPLSALDAIRVAEDVTGRRFAVQRAPVALLKVARMVVGPFHPPLDALLGLIIDQAAGHGVPPAPLYDVFDVRATTFAEYVRQALARPSP